MRIVLTNDDGIDAPGLIALYKAIAGMGTVHVVAPDRVRSAMGHAVTYHRPIPAARRVVVDRAGGGAPLFEGHAVDGTPADCVKLAIAHLVRDKVDLVISGMNAGANVGVNVNYSGTVAAAREAAMMGIPAIAMSLHIGDPGKTRWDLAAGWARGAIDRLVLGPIAPGVLLNVNLPTSDDGSEPRGVRVVPPSLSPLRDRYDEITVNHERVFWPIDGFEFHAMPENTDVHALHQRYVTVSPLTIDAGHHGQLAAWSGHLGNV